MAYRSCEQGLSTCLLFQSQSEGVFTIDNEKEKIVSIQVSSIQGLKRLHLVNQFNAKAYYNIFVYELLKDGSKRFISNRENEVLVALFDPSKLSQPMNP